MMILNPGPLTTVQDLGRHNFLSAGFCPSGVMDESSAMVANALVGNDAGEAVLEMTMMGITAQFLVDACIAITGADMEPRLNGQPVNNYRAFNVREGDELVCGYAKSGCRGYIAVAGGIDVPTVLGSRSTHLKCGIGGFKGRQLRKGDVLVFGKARGKTMEAIVPAPYFGESIVIRVTEGPQADYFTPSALDVFLTGEYVVSPLSDRMGIRLEGPLLESINGTDIISDCIPHGAIQVPDSGKPIILLADRQTVGGYAKPWVVIGADIPGLGQARPGTKLRFKRVTVSQARRIARKKANKY